MTADELEGLLEDRVPIFIKRQTDRMPEKCKRVAAAIVRRMFPAVREPCRVPSEEVPGYPFWPYIHRSQGNQLHRTYQTTFFEEFTASRILRKFTFLNSAFHKLASRRWMPKTENFETILGCSGYHRTGFLDAHHTTEMNGGQVSCQCPFRAERFCRLAPEAPSTAIVRTLVSHRLPSLDIPTEAIMTCMEGPRLRLRPATADDAAARFMLGHNREIVRMFGVSHADTNPMTMETAEAWARAHAANPHVWIIEVAGRLIGEIKLHSVNAQDRRASMAIAIYDPQQLGKGFGSEAIGLLLHHAFTELNLHRIGIRVLAYNERAIRAYQKCGFIIEGRERETAFVDGVWHDDLMMGILSREFQGPGR